MERMGNHLRPGVNGGTSKLQSRVAKPATVGYIIGRMFRLAVSTTVLMGGLLSLPVHAVIVAGASGGGNTSNNTTAAQFTSEFGGLKMDIYDHIIRFGGGTASYLGYDPATREVWVLAPRHVNPFGTATTVTIEGLDYDQQSYTVVNGDIAVVKYKRVDNQVPTLAPLELSTTIPTLGTPIFMAGFGRNRIENATTNALVSDAVSTTVGTGYNWGSDANRIKRWGTNNVGSIGTQTISMGSFNTDVFLSDFTEPTAGSWLSSNEAQGSPGDSGGGAFILVDGDWVLAGIMSTVSSEPGQDAETSAFGNLTAFTDISTYKSEIDTAIGVTLIPEASSGLLPMAGGLLLLRRKR